MDCKRCEQSGALHPVIQNRFNSIQYCGKRSKYPLKDYVRPIKAADGGGFKCPDGYQACNEEFFEKDGGADFVVCWHESEYWAEVCPITSLAFAVDDSLLDQYEFIENPE